MSKKKCKGLTGQALIDCYKKPGGIIYNYKKMTEAASKRANELRRKNTAKQQVDTTNTSKHASEVRVSQPLAPTQFNK